MVHGTCMAAAFMLASAVAQANQCSNGGQEVSAGDDANLPPDYFALLQTKLHLTHDDSNPISGAQHTSPGFETPAELSSPSNSERAHEQYRMQQHSHLEGQQNKNTAAHWKQPKRGASDPSMLQEIDMSRPETLSSQHHTAPQVKSAHGLTHSASSTVAPELDSYAKQISIFISVAAVLGPMIIVYVWQQHNNHLQCSAFLLAGLSCIFFGVENFLIDYAASYLHGPSAHMCMKFLLDGFIAFSLHIAFSCRHSSYKSEWHNAVASWGSMMLLALTGIFIAAAQLCGNIGFGMDQTESGPNQALVCATVLVVAPFFYWYCGEMLSKFQLIGCMMIVIGAVVLSDVSHWGDHPHSLGAFAWLLLSMIFYSASIVTWRIVSTGDGEVPWRPRLLFIFGVMGALGCSSFSFFFYAGGFMQYVQTPALLAWPLLTSTASFLGMWCVNLAFQDPKASAGALTAIVDSNAIILIIMNRILLNMVPSLTKVIGMILILIGCISISCIDLILAPSQLDGIDKLMCDREDSSQSTGSGAPSEGAESAREGAAEDGSQRVQ